MQALSRTYFFATTKILIISERFGVIKVGHMTVMDYKDDKDRPLIKKFDIARIRFQIFFDFEKKHTRLEIMKSGSSKKCEN